MIFSSLNRDFFIRVLRGENSTPKRSSESGGYTASSNWRAYNYDPRGNVIGDGKHNFVYDGANQPISIGGYNTGTYTYDGNLKRVREVVDGQTIYSVYSKSGALLTRDNVSNGKKTDYLNVSGQTFVRNTNGVPAYPLNDALGTAYMVADSNGNVTATYNYTPFGESLGTGPGISGEQGYTGHIEDKTGLTYMQARYYDPIIGRFLSPDPIGYQDQLNLYSYVGSDPVNFFDPTGLKGLAVIGDEGFKTAVNAALKQLEKTETGKSLLKGIKEAKKDATIMGALAEGGTFVAYDEIKGSNGEGSDAILFLDADAEPLLPTTEGATKTPLAVVLGHELDHVVKAVTGTVTPGDNPETGVPKSEEEAVETENKVREEMDLPQRTRY